MPDAYLEGMEARGKGVPFTHNPYAQPSSEKDHFVLWQAGWCWKDKVVWDTENGTESI